VLADAVRDGAVGVAVGTAVGPDQLDAPAYEPLWEGVARLGVPVFVHPNYPWTGGYPGLDDFHFQNVLGHPLETTITVERLICAGVLDRHPRLRLVLAHGGGHSRSRLAGPGRSCARRQRTRAPTAGRCAWTRSPTTRRHCAMSSSG